LKWKYFECKAKRSWSSYKWKIVCHVSWAIELDVGTVTVQHYAWVAEDFMSGDITEIEVAEDVMSGDIKETEMAVLITG
jgi:hypothetical protein